MFAVTEQGLESGREEEGQAESEADGRGREGEGGWAGTEMFTLGLRVVPWRRMNA